MNSLNTLIIVFLLALLVSMNACETTAKSRSCSADQMCGIQGSPGEWNKYWGP
jgi:hypothetical protein